MLTDFGGRTLCTRVESGSQAQDAQIAPANYIVSVSQSKRYLFAYQLNCVPDNETDLNTKTFSAINVIDILKEMIVAQIRTDNHEIPRPGPFKPKRLTPANSKVTSLCFDEKSCCLFLGYLEGEVESYYASQKIPG